MNSYISEQYRDLAATARKYQKDYTNAHPFPSIHFKNFFNPEYLDKVLAEFPDLSKQDVHRFDDARQKKFAGKGEKSFGVETRRFMHYLNSEPFLEFVQIITGIKETLIGDPFYSGGGLHEIKPGGLLKVHADFNKHPTLELDRRVNVLVYLNKDWKPEYGGAFELWDKDMTKCEAKIPCEFNTLAMFSTTDYSNHGHPDPLTCPEGRSRKSLALYYFSNGRPASEINPELREHSTLFKERGGNEADKAAFAQVPKYTLKDFAKDVTPPIVVKSVKRLMK